MNFQHYKNLIDKSDERLEHYIKQVVPPLSKPEIQLMLQQVDKKKKKKAIDGIKKGSIEGFYEMDWKQNIDSWYLSNLISRNLMFLYKTFVSKELTGKDAVKWRFYQYLKYIRDITVGSIQCNEGKNNDDPIDFIIETKSGKIVFVSCFYILELKNYEEWIKKVNEFANKHNFTPDMIYIIANKTYRDIPIDEDIEISNKSVKCDLWLEWIDLEKPFNGEDLLIVNDYDYLQLAGYNFNSTQNLLDYLYEFTEGGQIAIYKKSAFFSELMNKKKETEIELIWKGIMIKNFN